MGLCLLLINNAVFFSGSDQLLRHNSRRLPDQPMDIRTNVAVIDGVRGGSFLLHEDCQIREENRSHQ